MQDERITGTLAAGQSSGLEGQDQADAEPSGGQHSSSRVSLNIVGISSEFTGGGRDTKM